MDDTAKGGDGDLVRREEFALDADAVDGGDGWRRSMEKWERLLNRFVDRFGLDVACGALVLPCACGW